MFSVIMRMWFYWSEICLMLESYLPRPAAGLAALAEGPYVALR
jgi:hypothetical protein